MLLVTPLIFTHYEQAYRRTPLRVERFATQVMIEPGDARHETRLAVTADIASLRKTNGVSMSPGANHQTGTTPDFRVGISLDLLEIMQLRPVQVRRYVLPAAT